MRIRREALDFRVVVRRVTVGSAPYAWEVRGEDGVTPVQVSPDRFRSMETALKEGQAWMAEFLSQRFSSPQRAASPVRSDPMLAADASELTDEPRQEFAFGSFGTAAYSVALSGDTGA